MDAIGDLNIKYPFGGVHERADKTYAVTPRMPLGKLDADQLEAVVAVVRRFGLIGVQVTTGQRITIEGIPAACVDEVVSALHGVGDRCPQGITACRGRRNCKNGLQDTQTMASRLEELFIGLTQMPAHIKAGISGCPRCCGASYVRDIGLVGTPKGWNLMFGGNAGRRARCGDEILVDASEMRLLEILKAVLVFYGENAKKGERTSRFVERVGIETMINVLQ